MLRPCVQNETVKINEFSASECLRVFVYMCMFKCTKRWNLNEKARILEPTMLIPIATRWNVISLASMQMVHF